MGRLRRGALVGSQVSKWHGNADLKIDLPARGGPDSGWVQFIDDPLTSLTNYTPGAAGTWSIDTYVKATGPSATQMRLLSTIGTPTSPAGAYIVECEVEVPASFTSNNDHLSIGWHAADTPGKYVGVLRGDNLAAWLNDGVAWGASVAWSRPATGTWVKIRVLWDATANIWKMWIDGELYLTTSITQGFVTAIKPSILYYNDTASVPARMRNHKAWYMPLSSYTTFPA